MTIPTQEHPMPQSKPPRFAQLTPDQMTDAQQKAAEQILAGAKKHDGPGGRYMAQSGQLPGPYNFLLRIPELAMHCPRPAQYSRFHTSVPLHTHHLTLPTLIQTTVW